MLLQSKHFLLAGLAVGTALSPTLAAAEIAFSDIENHSAQVCIEQLADQGLVIGYGDGTYRPEQSVTRMEFSVLLLNAFPDAEHWLYAPTDPRPRASLLDYSAYRNFGTQETPIDFTDISRDYWGYEALQRASARRFFVGYPDGRFRPDEPITRVQATSVMAGELRFAPPTNSTAVLSHYFDDAEDIPEYALGAMSAATLGRLAINVSNVRKFRPNQPMTRGEVAALLCQGLGLARTVPPEHIAAGDLFDIVPEAGGRRPFAEGLAVALVDSQYGYIGRSGELAIAAEFDKAEDFQNGVARVEQAGFVQYIDRTGQIVESPVETGAEEAKDGEAIAQLLQRPVANELTLTKVNGKYGYADANGNLVIEPQFSQAQPFSEGLAGVQLPGQAGWGFINTAGAIVIPGPFGGPVHWPGVPVKAVEPFSEGFAVVRQGEKVGLINRDGDFVIEPRYDNALSVSDGFALVNIQATVIDHILQIEPGAGNVAITQVAPVGGIWGYIRVESE